MTMMTSGRKSHDIALPIARRYLGGRHYADVVDGRLHYRPPSHMTPGLLAVLRAHRAETVALVCDGCGRFLRTPESRNARRCLVCLGDDEYAAVIARIGARQERCAMSSWRGLSAASPSLAGSTTLSPDVGRLSPQLRDGAGV